MGIIRAALRSTPADLRGICERVRGAAGMDERIQPFEVIETDSRTVGCDGGGGPLGHPMVYLDLGATGKVECPYCSRLYVLKPGAAAQEH
jgi:uncharacterized Zn-finger protein